MQVRELIEWFGIQPDTYWSHEKEYWETLHRYCKYKRLDNKTFLIQQVYVPIYKGYSIKKKDYTIGRAAEEVWGNNGIDTFDSVYGKLLDKEAISIGNSREEIIESIINYLKWGYGYSLGSCGVKGNAYEIICTKKNGVFCALTKEEQKIFRKLQSKYFGDDIIERILFADVRFQGEEIEHKDWLNFLGFTEENKEGLIKDFYQITGLQVCFGISLIKFEEETDEEEIEELMRDNDGIKRAL